MSRPKWLAFNGDRVMPGETRDILLKISETYLGNTVGVPVRVIRAKRSGPTVFITGALHGDEINGTGIVREVMFSGVRLERGSLICVPVVNIFGFERHSRYLPDRRDLNRSFPGDDDGSVASRLARVLFDTVVRQSDYGIDLHSAPARRTNFPQVRANLKDSRLRRLAMAFGCEAVVNNRGPEGSLRRAACDAGCRTFIYEAGEAFKFESPIIDLGVRGIWNSLRALGMLDGEVETPLFQSVIEKTVWVRANDGGLLRFHVKPGDFIEAGQPIATCEQLLTIESNTLKSPTDGMVLGMSTLPAVKPGDPICHIALLDERIEALRQKLKSHPKNRHQRLQRDIATSFVIEPAA